MSMTNKPDDKITYSTNDFVYNETNDSVLVYGIRRADVLKQMVFTLFIL